MMMTVATTAIAMIAVNAVGIARVAAIASAQNVGVIASKLSTLLAARDARVVRAWLAVPRGIS
jgi:preprotein translocase subunit SecF